jgi:hypothetical protein
MRIWFSLKSTSRRGFEQHGEKDSSLWLNWCPKIPSQASGQAPPTLNHLTTSQAQILAVTLGCRQVQSLKREEQAEFYRLSRKEALLTVADNLVKAAGGWRLL